MSSGDEFPQLPPAESPPLTRVFQIDEYFTNAIETRENHPVCVPNGDGVGGGGGGKGQSQNGNIIGDTRLFVGIDQQAKITKSEEFENEIEDTSLTPAEIPTTAQAQDEPLQPPPAPAESPPPVTHEVFKIEVHEEWLTTAVDSMKTDPVCQHWIIPYSPIILCMIERPSSEVVVPNESPCSTKISSVSSGDDFPI